MKQLKENIYWFYCDHIQNHVDTFISAGLTTIAIVLVLRFLNVLTI